MPPASRRVAAPVSSSSAPMVLVAKTSSNVSGGVSSMGTSGDTPVENTTRSSPPRAATDSSRIRAQSAASRTSPTTTVPPPASDAADSSLSRLRAEKTTSAPARTASMPTWRPMPVEAPTTSTRAPARSAAIASSPNCPADGSCIHHPNRVTVGPEARLTTQTHTTICRFCHAYCGIEVDVVDNRAVAVRGDRAHAVSQGFTCEKGRQLPAQHHDRDRLRATVRRRADGSFEEVPSERAMDEVAAQLQQIIAEHGPRSVALYNGTKSWSNVSFALGLSWLEGIGSPSFYPTVTVDQPAKTMAGALHGYWQGGLHRIDDSDVVMFVGTNPLQS